ncbi:MAG: hypothetical protein ACE5EC_06760, partial [Phycisphaerae bacterium]
RSPLCVAYLPNSPATEARWRNVEPAMEQVIASACRDRGIPYLSCSFQAVPRTNYDYLEELHTGLPLARRITRRIAKHIVQLGWLDNPQSRIAITPESDMPLP